MTILKKEVKKTGYADIDNLLVETHSLLLQGDQLKKDIDRTAQYRPLKLNSPNKKYERIIKNFI